MTRAKILLNRRMAIIFILFISILLISGIYQEDFYQNKTLQYLVEVLSGSWSLDKPKSVSNFLFTLSAFGGIILNIGSFYAVFSILAKAKNIRRELEENSMKLKDVLAMRDLSIKGSILSMTPPDRREEMINLLKRAFASGDESWRGRLDDFLGSSAAQMARDTLNTNLGQKAKPKTQEFN